MKRRHLIGLIIILVFIVFCGTAFSQSLTPYVSLAEAISSGKTVQVKGVLNSQVETIDDPWGISFVLQDDAGTMVQVFYPGTKPENMEHAESVVVIGRYADAEKAFQAEKILVKCPSKYQEQGGER